MAIIVASATAEVGFLVAAHIFKPPGFFFGVEDLFQIFGLFLMVLIGLKLMMIFGIGFMIIALAVGYYLVRRSSVEPKPN